MKPRIRLAVLKVLSLQAEFSSSELEEAYKFIESSQLKDIFGLDKVVRQNSSAKSTTGSGSVKKSMRSTASEAILERVKQDDLEKYKLLDSLETQLRSSGLELKLDVIRKIAFSIDKSIDLGKSKKDAIPKFIELLARISLDDVSRIIQQISNAQESSSSNSNKYFKLASYIVKGG